MHTHSLNYKSFFIADNSAGSVPAGKAGIVQARQRLVGQTLRSAESAGGLVTNAGRLSGMVPWFGETYRIRTRSMTGDERSVRCKTRSNSMDTVKPKSEHAEALAAIGKGAMFLTKV
jgi:hypothetical protein